MNEFGLRKNDKKCTDNIFKIAANTLSTHYMRSFCYMTHQCLYGVCKRGQVLEENRPWTPPPTKVTSLFRLLL